MSDNFHLCIHGHFYQPPRENPWIEQIEQQESAKPFHDWNDRIHHECYGPNARARVLDAAGRVTNIVNNYESISFNFGPTLLSWLERSHPDTYRRIIEADAASVRAHGGHGNAIAQAYNHVILPLANRRDKVTQVRWGAEDFRHRFGREPESIWLPETACNEETLEVLVEEGFRYVILEPHQAEAFRPIGGEPPWTGAEDGSIDPKRPYRCFLAKDPSKFIDVFFYDGPISKAVGFEDLLFDARRFMDRLAAAKVEGYDGPQLINISTDGETYGHHKAYGDRVLAYLTAVEAPARNVRLVNYGEFLDLCPPRHEVRLKPGENGEGTSWSCAHGVRRWKDHCGCRGDGPPEWTQEWRAPLRAALDWLRDELAAVFEEEGAKILRDPWRARDEYVRVLLDRRGERAAKDFYAKHCLGEGSPEKLVRAFKLLEMQRHAMLMYTSCGWFFTEFSGIETVKIVEYAARAIQLARDLSPRPLEDEFTNRLARAKSNVPEFGDGRAIYDRFVRPRVISHRRIAAHYGLGSIFDGYYPDERRTALFGFDVERIGGRKETFGNVTLNAGRIRVRSRVTLEERTVSFVAAQTAHYDFHCWVGEIGEDRFAEIEKALFAKLQSLEIVDLFKTVDGAFERHYTLKDLLFEDRLRILSILTRETLEKIGRAYEALYDDNLKMTEVYRSINLPIPAEVRAAAEHTLTRRLDAAVRDAAVSLDDSKAARVTRPLEIAESFGLSIDTKTASKTLGEALAARVEELLAKPARPVVEECLALEALARRIGVRPDVSAAQERLFDFLRIRRGGAEAGIDSETLEAVVRLADALSIHADEFKRAIGSAPAPEAAVR